MSIPRQLNNYDVSVLTDVMGVPGLKKYTYLEIGSYLGGSLVWHLENFNCSRVISVDKRSQDKINDERAIDYAYTVTTQDMLTELKNHNIPTDKLECIDGTVNDVPTNICADIVFIDGEHTNVAAFSDAMSCLHLINESCIILFHDDWVVYQGIEKFYSHLKSIDTPAGRFKFTLSDITAIVVGPMLSAFESFAESRTTPWDEFVEAASNRLTRERNKGQL